MGQRVSVHASPTRGYPNLPFILLVHTSGPSLPKSYPLRFQIQLKRNVLHEALSCCPWLKAAWSGPCIPLRTLQKGWCPQGCPPGTWAQCGLTWTKADCSYLPGTKEAKMLSGNWPQRSSLPAPHLNGAGRFPLSPHGKGGHGRGCGLGAPQSLLPSHKHPAGSSLPDLGYR